MRKKIMCFISGDPGPVLTIECWDFEVKGFMDNLSSVFIKKVVDA